MMGRKSGQIGMLMVDVGSMIPICIESGLVDGNAMAADGSYLPSNVFRNSWVDIELEVEKSMQSYLNRLDEELAEQPGFKKPPAQIVKKSYTISTTDPDCGYINHGNKCGIGYLMEATVDCKHGILTGVGVDVYAANRKESLLVLRHLERQIQYGVPMKQIALDRGMTQALSIVDWSFLVLPDIFPQFSFPTLRKNMAFSMHSKRTLLSVQKENCLDITNCIAISLRGNTCVTTKQQNKIASFVPGEAVVWIKSVLGEEFWPVAAILRFSGGTPV